MRLPRLGLAYQRSTWKQVMGGFTAKERFPTVVTNSPILKVHYTTRINVLAVECTFWLSLKVTHQSVHACCCQKEQVAAPCNRRQRTPMLQVRSHREQEGVEWSGEGMEHGGGRIGSQQVRRRVDRA